MNRMPDLSAMTEATALTRAGRLAEASAVIQRGLSGRPARGDGTVPGEVPREERRADAAAEHRAGGLRGWLRDRVRRSPTPAAAPRPFVDVRTAPAPPPGRPGTAPSGTTSVHLHSGAAGDRPYTLYVPTTGTGPRPLVVLLHGGTQTAAAFAAATGMNALAQERGFLVAYPEQVTSANAMRYWNWFQPADQQRGAGEPAILAGIIAEIAATHEVDRDRVYVAGFSAGAAMAAVLGAAYPDVVAAVGVHSGLPYGSAHDVASGFSAMRAAPAGPPVRPVPVITFHGDADPTVAAANATRVVEQFTGGPATGDTVVERGPGRPATRTVVRRNGVVVAERWTVHGSGHAWSGGAPGGSYTDPDGPDASAEMVRFFLDHPAR